MRLPDYCFKWSGSHRQSHFMKLCGGRAAAGAAVGIVSFGQAGATAAWRTCCYVVSPAKGVQRDGDRRFEANGVTVDIGTICTGYCPDDI